jgi:cytochrome c-type biogenesis protein CcmE
MADIIEGKKLKFLIGGIVILLILAYLVYSGMRGSMVYYLTVSELKAKADSLYGQGLRVSGEVVKGSIQWNAAELELRFQLMDQGDKLPVVYHGVKPDMFKDGAQVVVEGQYTTEGLFVAQTLLTSCPSKYEAKNTDGRAKIKP